ncbi:helix-turn-helix domain-containing protein [Brevibacillus laterosporus]
MNIFSARIKWLRQNKGFTQAQVADFIGMSTPGYTKIEQGQREPNLETLARFPIILDESLDFMLGITDFDKKALQFLLHFKSLKKKIEYLQFEIDHAIRVFDKDFPNIPKETMKEFIQGPSLELVKLKPEYDRALNQLISYYKTIPLIKIAEEQDMIEYFANISEADTYTSIKVKNTSN